MKNIVLLGSTGSIGRSCLAVVREFPSRFKVAGLATWSHVEALAEQVEEFRPDFVSIGQEGAAERFRRLNSRPGLEVLQGESGLVELVRLPEVRLVVNALVGAAGLVPTVEAVCAGKDLALANKESLVLAGELVMKLVKERGTQLVPIDSEHSAIHQCLAGRTASVRRIVLTASGGPFNGRRMGELETVTPEEVLRHPVWDMGSRICVDSANLLNKGLEVMEARWLFDIALRNIGVLLHPQCIVHGLVEFTDGTTLAQMSRPDMKIPILYALSHPEQLVAPFESCSLAELGTLTFEEPDLEQYPCLRLAYEAARAGGTVPASLNAADEVAVEAFLKRRIAFTDIPRILEDSLERLEPRQAGSVESVMAADGEARAVAEKLVSKVCGR
ncbi:MAG: 1-deoxy-D-xylulose-5-phosphate reductoisomerase [Candidatus Eiseniibacteriota bacterium]|nr:MAG: 1-deoxy-D-xylulose-5-phosphate reductoisomerase [Candidatus Eisenbacteria bacterium]